MKWNDSFFKLRNSNYHHHHLLSFLLSRNNFFFYKFMKCLTIISDLQVILEVYTCTANFQAFNIVKAVFFLVFCNIFDFSMNSKGDAEKDGWKGFLNMGQIYLTHHLLSFLRALLRHLGHYLKTSLLSRPKTARKENRGKQIIFINFLCDMDWVHQVERIDLD